MTELTDVPSAFGYGDSILVGTRVRLRGVRDEDLPALARWEMDPGRMTTLSDRVAPMSEAAARERIAKFTANDGNDAGFAIETLGDQPVLVGSLGLWGARPKDRCASLGIALGREHAGRGYGSDAMRVIVGYGFREMGLHRIQLGVFPFNPAGIRAYEKAGFVEEGRRREAVLHDGRWYDDILMSVLDHEWAARRLSGTSTQNVQVWPAARVEQTEPNVDQNGGSSASSILGQITQRECEWLGSARLAAACSAGSGARTMPRG